MALDTQIRIIDRAGDQADQRKKTIIRTTDAAMVQHPALSLGAGVKTAVDFGGVTTAAYVCVIPDSGTIQVYRNNSPESWSVTGMFVAIGCSITALALEASVATTVWVLIAGT